MFYEQLQKACSLKDTSITATLKALGIGTSNGTYWKNGSMPNGDIITKLSEYLGVSTDYLLKGECHTAPPVTSDPDELDKVIQQFCDKFDLPPGEARKRIAESLRIMLEGK